MGKYKAFLKQVWRSAFVYRARFVIWTMAHPLRLFLMLFLWSSIYSFGNLDVLKGYTLIDMVNYYIVLTVFASTVYTQVDWRLNSDVVSGNFVRSLVRPVNPLIKYMVSELGWKCFSFFAEMLPVLLIGIIIFGFSIYSFPHTILSVLSFLLGFMINYGFAFLFGLSSFWILYYEGLGRVKNAVGFFFSGALIPLTLFPSWAQGIVMMTPFPYTRFIPAQIFLGKYDVQTSILFLVLQLVWVVVLILLAGLGLRKGIKKFAGVGV